MCFLSPHLLIHFLMFKFIKLIGREKLFFKIIIPHSLYRILKYSFSNFFLHFAFTVMYIRFLCSIVLDGIKVKM